jgi:dsDNA-binding SOS-regulon protein
MSTLANDVIKIAFDNGGGAILNSKTYAHAYDDMAELATDVQALLDGGDTNDWDGNDEELLAALTQNEMDRYERVYRLTEVAILSNREYDADENNWGSGARPQNGSGFAEFEFWAALVAEQGE